MAARVVAPVQVDGEFAQLQKTRGLVLGSEPSHPPRRCGAAHGHGRWYLHERLVPAGRNRRRDGECSPGSVQSGEHGRLPDTVQTGHPSDVLICDGIKGIGNACAEVWTGAHPTLPHPHATGQPRQLDVQTQTPAGQRAQTSLRHAHPHPQARRRYQMWRGAQRMA